MKNSRIKSRKIKNIIRGIVNNIKFKIETFNISKIFLLVGILLGIISLFISHIKPLYSNIFNKITIFSGIIVLIIITIISFLLFSFNKKEKIKKTTNIVFRDYLIIIYLSIILFIISINNLSVINGLKTFTIDITYGAGVIFLLISSIFILIGGILLKNEYKSSNKIYLNDSEEEQKQEIKNKNTKLPF